MINEQLFKDYCVFATKQLYSTDVDPVYPVLHDYYESNNFSMEQKIWKTYLYESCYSLQSAEILWKKFPEPRHVFPDELIGLKTGIERRGFRGQPELLAANINSFIDITEGCLEEWVEMAVYSGGEKGWNTIRTKFEEIKYNGTWASYKFADLVKHVLGYEITASDIGVGGKGETAGPIPGMVRVTGYNWKECAEDIELQHMIYEEFVNAGVSFNGLDQMETVFCDFNSLCKGGYYISHDIDSMMEQLPENSSLWECRKNVIPSEFLGELNGWFGIRKELKSLYKETGILNWGW